MIDRSNLPAFKKHSTSTRFDFWSGWSFDGDFIRDPDGNHYTEKDILLSWMSQQVVKNFEGSSGATITSLKLNLEKKIALTSVPVVCLVYDTPDGVVEKVFDLVEK